MSKPAIAKAEQGFKTIGVKQLATVELKANPHNPRVLFDKLPLAILRASIEKVGILVPLTVYQDKRHGYYVILDGQRRWMCARELGLKKIPVNEVQEPSLVQNIVTMFQIHKLREDWDLMPTALKLELLMAELQEKNDKKLAMLTGLDVAVVSRCKKLLSYAKKYQEKMLDPDPEKRIKADFFIELYAVRNDRVVKAMPWFKPDRFTGQMLKRYQAGGFKSVTDFRTVKQHINNAKNANKIPGITRRLREFAENQELGIDHLELRSASVAHEASVLRKKLSKLYGEISEIDVESMYGETELWESLESLSALIDIIMKKADRRKRP